MSNKIIKNMINKIVTFSLAISIFNNNATNISKAIEENNNDIIKNRIINSTKHYYQGVFEINNDLAFKDFVYKDMFSKNGYCRNEILANNNIIDKITSINGRPFTNDANLRDNVYIPNVESIGELAFYNCVNIKNLYMPDVKKIDNFNFMECKNLESVYMPNVEFIENFGFKSNYKLKTIYMPKVKAINCGAFSKCKSLTKLVMPSTVEEIGEGAFKSYSKHSLTIDFSNVKDMNKVKIGKNAFKGCILIF